MSIDMRCAALTTKGTRCSHEAFSNTGVQSDDPKRRDAWLCGTHMRQFDRHGKLRLVPVDPEVSRVQSYEARRYAFED